MKQRLHHGVAAVLEVELTAHVDDGPGVVVLHGHHGKGAQHVQSGHRLGGGLHPGQLVRYKPAHLLKELGLQGDGFVVGAQNAVFQVFQLLGDVALAAGEGLLADVILGHLVFVAVGHLDVIAEHPVVAGFQLGDAGALPLPGLYRGDELPAAVHVPLDLVQLLVVAVPDDVPLPDGEGRVVHNGGVNELGHVLQAVHLLAQLLEQRGLAALQQREEPRQPLEGRGQRAQLPAVGRAVDNAGHDAL